MCVTKIEDRQPHRHGSRTRGQSFHIEWHLWSCDWILCRYFCICQSLRDSEIFRTKFPNVKKNTTNRNGAKFLDFCAWIRFQLFDPSSPLPWTLQNTCIPHDLFTCFRSRSNVTHDYCKVETKMSQNKEVSASDNDGL